MRRIHHGPSPDDHRRQHNKDGLIWAQLGCGHTTTGSVWPRIWSVDRYHRCYVSFTGIGQIQRTEKAVCSFHMGIKHISKDPPPLHL
jgi:hypothetical protein